KQDSCHDRFLAPDRIGDQTAAARSDKHPEENGRTQKARRSARQVKGRDDARQHETHDLDIEAIAEMPQQSDAVDFSVSACEGRFVETLKQSPRYRHSCSPVPYLRAWGAAGAPCRRRSVKLSFRGSAPSGSASVKCEL